MLRKESGFDAVQQQSYKSETTTPISILLLVSIKIQIIYHISHWKKLAFKNFNKKLKIRGQFRLYY